MQEILIVVGENKFNAVRFVPKDDRGFGITLRKRVNAYFKAKGFYSQFRRVSQETSTR